MSQQENIITSTTTQSAQSMGQSAGYVQDKFMQQPYSTGTTYTTAAGSAPLTTTTTKTEYYEVDT